MTDAQVVRKVLAGDADAYALLVERHQRAAVAAAHHLTGDREAARDIAQDAFVDAWRGLNGLRDHSKFAGWLLGIIRNKCRGYLAKLQPDVVPLDDAPAPSTDPPQPEGGPLTEMLGKLPLKDREILAARYIAEMPYTEIAREMDMTVNNVRVRCCRARQRLRELMAETGEEGEGS
ncbi:MAG: sigma-70 family RNA polymerase sigma factor [Armatimonadota bacterium]|nr:sigma-70 family RNA polymerase sigma factor [Armatimonadota bacterium]